MSDDRWPEHEQQDPPNPKETFWTLRIRELSDDEFIEQLRKSAAWSKRWWWLKLVPLAVVAMMGWEVMKFANGPGPIGPARFGRNEVLFWASLTGIVSFGMGFKVGHAFMATSETLWGDRGTELLIHYHDLLNEHNLLNQATTNNSQPDQHM